MKANYMDKKKNRELYNDFWWHHSTYEANFLNSLEEFSLIFAKRQGRKMKMNKTGTDEVICG